MRYATLLSLQSIFIVGLHAQWTNNVLLNTSVRSGSGVDAVTPLTTDGPDGSTYISWFDNGTGGYQLRMQRLDANGFALWDAAGLVVSAHPQNSALFRYDLKTDNEGNAIVAFQDERTGHLDIVAYKVSPDGDELWGADGVALTDDTSTEGLAPVIGVLASNEVVIAWSADDGSDKWVAVQHLLADGTVPFATPSQITGPDKYSRPKVIPTSDNGCFVQYVQEVGNFPFTCTMYAQRIDGYGTVVGTYTVSTKHISAFYFPEPVADGGDGFYMAYTTSNPDNQALSDVYVQHMDHTGFTWSDAGVEAAVGTSTQKFTPGCVLLPGMLGVMVPLQVTNTGQSMGGISVQRVDVNGAVQLGAGGMEVLPLSADLPSPDDAAATSDGAIVVYSSGGFGNEHISAVRLGADGSTVWTPFSTVLCSANSNKDDASCGSFVNGQLVTVWDDDRVGMGVFAQNVFGDGTTGTTIAAVHEINAVPEVRLEANPSDSPTLVFGPRDAGPCTIMVVDARGGVVWAGRSTASAGRRVQLDAGDLPTGLYAIHVVGAASDRTLRWVKE